MADTVDTLVIFAGTRKYVTRLLNISDGTGEAAVKKVDISTITTANYGVKAARLVVERIDWNIQGFTSIKLNWDHTTPDEIATLSGVGYRIMAGATLSGAGGNQGLVDPKSAGGTGSIMLTAPSGATTGTYDITLTLRIK